jgi:hypothetical protein
MKGYKNLKEIEQACKEVNSCACGSDSFMYKCFPLLLKQLVEINQKLSKLEGKRTVIKTIKETDFGIQ